MTKLLQANEFITGYYFLRHQDRCHKSRELIFHLLQDNLSQKLTSFGT